MTWLRNGGRVMSENIPVTTNENTALVYIADPSNYPAVDLIANDSTTFNSDLVLQNDMSSCNIVVGPSKEDITIDMVEVAEHIKHPLVVTNNHGWEGFFPGVIFGLVAGAMYSTYRRKLRDARLQYFDDESIMLKERWRK